MHALEKEIATHSSIIAWRIPGTEEPGGLPSMGSHRVVHDWSNLAAAATCASKVMLKIPPARLQQYMNCVLPDIQSGFGKGRETKLPTSAGSSKKQELKKKKSTSALLIMPKPLTVFVDSQRLSTNCGKFLKEMGIQTTWPASWEICVQVRKQQLEQQIGSKLGKEHVKAVYCHSAYLIYMQRTSWEILG